MSNIKTCILLVLFSLMLFLPGISKVPVIDRDEAHFAQASKQMLQTGNYFQIRFQDRTRFQKPPGINWLQAASVALFSNADSARIWPYRLVSTLGALLSVLFAWLFARRFVPAKTAAIAAGMLASSLLLVVEAHMAVIDASLLSSVLLMQGSLWVIYQANIDRKSVHWGWSLCFWLAMSYGFVLKGVTPLFGLLTVITLCILEKRVDWLRDLRIYRGLFLFILLNVSWLLMVDSAEHSNYLLQMINRDLLPKLQGGHESHGRPPLFHLFILPLTFWPASLFLLPGAVYAWKNRKAPVVRFLLAWLLPSWIFFELMPTKLPQYVLPLFPALALLCAMAVEDQMTRKPERWLRVLQTGWGVLSAGLALALVLMAYLLMQQLTVISLILVILIGLVSLAAVYYARKGYYQTGAASTFLLASLAFPMIFNQLLPELQPLWFTAEIARIVDEHNTGSEKPLLVADFGEPSLVFNLDTHLVLFTDREHALNILSHDKGRLALFEEGVLSQWQGKPGKPRILAKIKGYDYSKGSWVNLILVKSEDGNATV